MTTIRMTPALDDTRLHLGIALLLGSLLMLTVLGCETPTEVKVALEIVVDGEMLVREHTATTPQTVHLAAGVGIPAGVRVDKVVFCRDGTATCFDVAEPHTGPFYAFEWSVSGTDSRATAYPWTATAHYTDAAGQAQTLTSNTVRVTVNIAGGRSLDPVGDADLVGFIPTVGLARGVHLDSETDLAYVASNEHGLTIVDISNPSAPVILGAAVPTFGGQEVDVEGSLAVVIGGGALIVVDVSDPFRPTPIGSVEGSFYGISIGGQYAYSRLAVPGNPGHLDLVVVSLEDPTHPTIVNQLFYAGGARVRYADSRLYVSRSGGLDVFDASNPRALRLLDSIEVPNGAGNLVLQGNYAYVGNSSGAHVVDIRNSSSLSIVGSIDLPCIHLAVAQNRLYAVYGESFRVFDVSIPSAPRLLGVGNSVAAQGIAADGNHVYLASPHSRLGGLYVKDVSNLSSITTLAYFPFGPGNAGIAASGPLAVVTASALNVVDVSEPTAPVSRGSIEGLFSGVAVAGQYAYARLTIPGNPATVDLVAVSLQNPDHPVIVDRLSFPGGDRIEIFGTLAYVTTGTRLQVVDISNPAALTLRGSVSVPGGAAELAVAGGYAYVGNLTATHVVDVRNPNSLSIVGSVSGGSMDLAISGDRLYSVLGGALRIMDVSNPVAPSLLGTGDGHSAWALEVVGDKAFLTSPAYDGGLFVVDVSDPTSPELNEQVRVPGAARSAAVDGDYLYVGDTISTLDIFQLTSP